MVLHLLIHMDAVSICCQKERWEEFESAGFEAASTFCVSPSAVSEILSRLLVIVKDVCQLCILQSVILSFSNRKQHHKRIQFFLCRTSTLTSLIYFINITSRFFSSQNRILL